MCVISSVGDYWTPHFPQRFPTFPEISREEFDKLKKEVEELKLLLLAAKRFDEETGQPNCSMEDKIKLIKEVAKVVGVDLKDIWPDE